MGHVYQNVFFQYLDISSTQSAENFLSRVEFPIEINHILDVGCGRGAWLAQWQKKEVEIFGLDGDYVDVNALQISKNNFLNQDLSKSFNLNRKFDLIQCLEVAEHIPHQYADTLIENIVAHGDAVLFSAAVPGQGGEFHVNEQPIAYWVEKFEAKGYVGFDCIRPQISHLKEIEPWYRFNMIFFMKEDLIEKLSIDVLKTRVHQNYDFNCFVDKKWLLRNKILSQLPESIINKLANLKHRMKILKK